MKVRKAARYQARNRRLRRRISFRAYVTLTIGPFTSGPEAVQAKRVSMLLDTAIMPAVRVLTVTDAEEVQGLFGSRDDELKRCERYFSSDNTPPKMDVDGWLTGEWSADAEL